MTPEQAVVQIQDRITPAPGPVFFPPEVVVGSSVAVRGIGVTAGDDGCVTIQINAEGRCLASMTDTVRALLGDAANFTHEPAPDTSSTVQDQSTDLDDEDLSDATVEETDDDCG